MVLECDRCSALVEEPELVVIVEGHSPAAVATGSFGLAECRPPQFGPDGWMRFATNLSVIDVCPMWVTPRERSAMLLHSFATGIVFETIDELDL
jgi:hypothetical protein